MVFAVTFYRTIIMEVGSISLARGKEKGVKALFPVPVQPKIAR